MPSLPNDGMASAYPLKYFSYGQAQSAASQSAVALKLNVNAATSGSLNITEIPMPFAGSIVGITAALTANKTAGVMTFAPTINGTALASGTGLSAVAMANATKGINKMIDANVSGARFAAGDTVGVKLTTDGSYAPTTNDLYVMVWVVFDKAQF